MVRYLYGVVLVFVGGASVVWAIDADGALETSAFAALALVLLACGAVLIQRAYMGRD